MKKYNFFLFAALTLLIYAIFIGIYYQKYRENAIEQALSSAQDFLRNAKAAKIYFNHNQKEKILNLTLQKDSDTKNFMPEFYSCTYASKKINEYYNQLRKQDGLQAIKLQFISDNPKNRNNLATEEDKELLDKFRSGEIKSYYKVYKNYYGENILDYAHIGQTIQQECLLCHGEPQNAPKALIKKYGRTEGFFNQIGDIHSFDRVLMPLDSFIAQQESLFKTRALVLLATLFIIFIISFLFFKKAHKETKKFQYVIDTLSELVIIKTNEKILLVNQSFLDFFNVKNIKKFYQKYSCLSNNFILEESNLEINLNHITQELIESLDTIDKSKRIISMQNAQGELKSLTIKIYKSQENEFVIVLSDITNMKHKTDMLEQKANVDALTKIFSRQKFNELYHLELRRSHRYINSLSLLFFDIDHFKKINDTYGHDVGDKTLITFAKVIQENIREYDIFARWGGEEFILLLPQTDMSAAFKIAEKLRQKVSDHNFGIIGTVTCSIGISMLKKDDDDDSFLKRADNAVYKAKKSGRNRTIIDF